MTLIGALVFFLATVSCCVSIITNLLGSYSSLGHISMCTLFRQRNETSNVGEALNGDGVGVIPISEHLPHPVFLTYFLYHIIVV